MTADGVCPRAPRRLIVPALWPTAPLAYMPYAYYVPCSSCDLSFVYGFFPPLYGYAVSLSIFNMIVDSGILPYLAYAYFIRHALRGIPPTPLSYHPILTYGVHSQGLCPFPLCFCCFLALISSYSSRV